MGHNPLYLMLPVGITCSFAFMLPMATIPNAIAYATGKIQVKDMVRKQENRWQVYQSRFELATQENSSIVAQAIIEQICKFHFY